MHVCPRQEAWTKRLRVGIGATDQGCRAASPVLPSDGEWQRRHSEREARDRSAQVLDDC